MKGTSILPAGPDPRNPVVYRDAEGFPGYVVGSDRSVWSSWREDEAPAGGWCWVLPAIRADHGQEVRLLRRPGPRRHRVSLDVLMAGAHPPRPASAPETFVPGSDRVGGRVKLDPEKVAELRRLKAEGWTYPRLAKHFVIARSTVHYALNGITWRHVPRVPAAVPAPPRVIAGNRPRSRSRRGPGRPDPRDTGPDPGTGRDRRPRGSSSGRSPAARGMPWDRTAPSGSASTPGPGSARRWATARARHPP